MNMSERVWEEERVKALTQMQDSPQGIHGDQVVPCNESVNFLSNMIPPIPKTAMKRRYGSVTLWLDQETIDPELPSSKIYPYACVEFDGKIRWKPNNNNGDGPFQIIDIHQQSLEDFILSMSNKLRWTERVQLLKDIAVGVKFYHAHGAHHKNLNLKCISVSNDGKHRPFIWKGDGSSEIHDMISLGRISYFILTNGYNLLNDNIDKGKLEECYKQDLTEDEVIIISTEAIETANDLIQLAIQNDIDINKFLEHPVFWTDKEKADFITDLYDSVGSESTTLDELQLLFRPNEEVFSGDWMKELKIRSSEKTAITKKTNDKQINKDLFFNKAAGKGMKIEQYQIRGHKLVRINMDSADMKKWKKLKKQAAASSDEENLTTICNTLSEKPDWLQDDKDWAFARNMIFRRTDIDPSLNSTSLHDLVRFIRNRKVHCWENGKISVAEKEYYEALGGYWKFYSKRYPKLLVFLFKHRDKFPFCNKNEHFGSYGVRSA